uniref:Lymphocyte antigen 6 family member M6 n=1 Tax=Cyprinus carpio TaxID=7962 RepID=A0A8C2K1G7_CYPCA
MYYLFFLFCSSESIHYGNFLLFQIYKYIFNQYDKQLKWSFLYYSCFLGALGVSSSLVTVKSCAPASCPSGSFNLGNIKLSSYCCSTDLCNDRNSPDPSTNTPNGKTCYFCDGQNCSSIMTCSGSEDRCFNATASFGGQPVGVKGCVSKAICDAASLIPNVQGISCCSGNLCNGAQSVTQSFLFLCCSLLSFILLH